MLDICKVSIKKIKKINLYFAPQHFGRHIDGGGAEPHPPAVLVLLAADHGLALLLLHLATNQR